MRVSVLIPTYHNPRKLVRCIDSLAKQSHLPDEVVVLHEKGDEDSLRVLQDFIGKLNLIPLQLKNMEHMSCTLNAGIKRASGDVIAFLDEDVAAKTDWLEKIIAEFDNEKIGACGGKDTIIIGGRKVFDDSDDDVGILKWKGYIVGNQHRGRKRRDVAFLKGCNMAVRKVFLDAFDENLLGLVRWEQDIFFHLRQKGKRVIYDPVIEVSHFKDIHCFLSPWFTFCFAHNTSYLFMKYFRGSNRSLAILFFFFFGDVSSPGLFRFLHWILTRNDQGLCSFCASLLGKLKGLATYANALDP